MISPELKRIVYDLGEFKWRLVIVAVSGISMALCVVLVARQTKFILDSMQFKDTAMLQQAAWTTIGLYFLLGIFRYIHIFTMNMTSELVVQKRREMLQEKLMKLSWTFHGSYEMGSGGLISRVMSDVAVLQNGLRLVADLFREPVILIGLLVILFRVNWQLTLTTLILFPILVLFLKWISKTIKKYSILGQKELERVTSTLKETLDGIKVIHSFNLENIMSNKFKVLGLEYLKSRKMVHSRVELSGPVTEFIAASVIMGIAIYIAHQITIGQATFGDFGSYLASLLMMGQPIRKIQESFVRIQETQVSAQRIFEILDDTSEVKESSNPLAFPKNFESIEYKNVSFGYKSQLVVQNFNIKIRKGETVAFVGSSGSGKSTVINLVSRFYDVTSGEITIGDIPIKNIALSDLRSHIAVVSQDVYLFNDTIKANLAFGANDTTEEKISAAAKAAYAEEFILGTDKGYDTIIGERGGLLSGGEKQRLSIARAFLKDAPILVLDEATSALDSTSEQAVQKGLDLLMKGRTVLLVAHRLSTVSKADRIIVMSEGKIIESGTHQELMTQNGTYSGLWSLQQGNS